MLSLFVRIVFLGLSATTWLVLLPLRAIITFVSGGAAWLVRLPFRILGLAARLIGLLVVLGLVVLVFVVLMNLLAAA